MKNQMKYITTVSLVSLLLFIRGTLAAQNTNTRERMIAVQSGTVTLENGKANIELNQQVQDYIKNSETSTYYVVFTPYDGAGSISLMEKSNDKFSIVGLNVVGAKTDYIVFLKQKIQVTSPMDNAAVNAK